MLTPPQIKFECAPLSVLDYFEKATAALFRVMKANLLPRTENIFQQFAKQHAFSLQLQAHRSRLVGSFVFICSKTFQEPLCAWQVQFSVLLFLRITLFFFLLLRGLAKQKRRCVDMVNRSVTFMMIAVSVKALKTTQHR